MNIDTLHPYDMDVQGNGNFSRLPYTSTYGQGKIDKNLEDDSFSVDVFFQMSH